MADILILVVFILLILAIVWGHFLAQTKTDDIDKTAREKTNKELYYEHKAEIELDFQQNKIDQESYQYLLAELDKGFLQDMEENQDSTKATIAVVEHKNMAIIWPISITLFILAFSFVVYEKTGAYEQLSAPQSLQDQHAGLDQEQQQSLKRLEQLKAQIQAAPKNSALWYSLGQELVALGDFDNALTAFDKTIEIEGIAADLVGAKAQATYYKYGQEMTPEVTALIEQALELDPTDASTNILLGMHAFGLANYQAAIDYWQGVIDANKSVNVAALTQVINEAKNRLGLAQHSVDTNVNKEVNPAVALQLNVSLSANIIEKMQQSADKTVFIYAIPAQGPRMPVAAVKIQASDLPIDVILDDSKAMNPQMKISNFQQVNIFAVVSQQGTPGIKTGDYTGQLDNVAVTSANALTIVIDTVAP